MPPPLPRPKKPPRAKKTPVPESAWASRQSSTEKCILVRQGDGELGAYPVESDGAHYLDGGLIPNNEFDRQIIAQAAKRLVDKLPPESRNAPDALALASMRCATAVDGVHLIYRDKHCESQSKDYEFSRLAMQAHWTSGHAHLTHTLRAPRPAQDIQTQN